MSEESASHFPQPQDEGGAETAEGFLEKLRNRDDVAVIFLKGGEMGGINQEVKEQIISHLSQWFEVTEGDRHKPNFEEIQVRWGGGMEYQFRKMENSDDFGGDFVDKGRQLLEDKNEHGFRAWLAEADSISGGDPGLLRQELMLDYFSGDGECVLLQLKDGVTRAKILQDMKLTDRDALVRAVGEKRADLDWTNRDQVSFPEFVKRINVGNTTAYKAVPETIRFIGAEALRNGAIRRAMEKARALERKNQDLWKVQPGDFNDVGDDEETVISAFLNVVHTVDFSIEEFSLMSRGELQRFSAAIA